MVDLDTLRLFASANRSIFKMSDGMTVLLLGRLVSIKAFEVCKSSTRPLPLRHRHPRKLSLCLGDGWKTEVLPG